MNFADFEEQGDFEALARPDLVALLEGVQLAVLGEGGICGLGPC